MSFGDYELVLGLETHVELATKTKIFCDCTTAFGGEPNTHCCPVCMGHPGTLPRLNRQVVRYAVRAGLAMDCEISEFSKMDRKNYCYPDLPKAYQISQYDRPLCENGKMQLSNGRYIRVLRIHIEEDAGKLIHRDGDVYVDYNRGGVPLIEIVTEPDFRSVDEVREYLERLQLLMKYLGVSDCKMQEGSLRCDVNISVRKKGTEKLGTRTELKNMNSFTNMEKAIVFEANRQIDRLERGEPVVQETRRYCEETGETASMRSKEDAQDYRYFREPDLLTVEIPRSEIEAIRSSLPELPQDRIARYQAQFQLSKTDAGLLVKYRRVADFFEEAIQGISNPKNASNLLLSRIFSVLPQDSEKEQFSILVSASAFHELLLLLDQKKITMQLAKTVLDQMLLTGKAVTAFLSQEDLKSLSLEELTQLCQKAMEANPKAVADYLAGKTRAVKTMIGFVMKETRGRADASAVQEILIKELQQS